MLTVGELIEQLKQYDPATLIVVPDPAASAEDWEDGTAWTDVESVCLRDTSIYRPRYGINPLTGLDAWCRLPAVRLACEYMEDLP